MRRAREGKKRKVAADARKGNKEGREGGGTKKEIKEWKKDEQERMNE